MAEFLRTEVMAATGGRVNALARDDQAGLAAAIRSGALAADDPAVLGAVRAAVTDRLAVANPRYLQQPG